MTELEILARLCLPPEGLKVRIRVQGQMFGGRLAEGADR